MQRELQTVWTLIRLLRIRRIITVLETQTWFEPRHDKTNKVTASKEDSDQPDLSLRWAHSHFVGFVMSWLIFHALTRAGPKRRFWNTSLAKGRTTSKVPAYCIAWKKIMFDYYSIESNCNARLKRNRTNLILACCYNSFKTIKLHSNREHFGRHFTFSLKRHIYIIWARARQNQQNDLCPQRRLRSAWESTESDQSSLCTSYRQQRLWSDWVDAQDDWSLRWAHMSFCWIGHAAAHLIFLMTYTKWVRW